MKAFQIQEAERLKSLESYNILDTLPEADYDDITYIATMICNTPIAIVSLIDKNRQFLKSKMGVNLTETPREHAFCAQAINTPDEMMIVHDSRKDKRFFNNPLVIGYPNIIFYAGMPLVNLEGYALGTLCVIDNKPRILSTEQQDALKRLSHQIVNILELRRSNLSLIKSQEQLSKLAQEMEDFAYLASHDLKEPLRMVKSFLTLLEDKYSEKEAKKYISYALDGANRMTDLINDLLEFSKVGKDNSVLEEVDINEVVNDIKNMFQFIIKDKKVVINSSKLPVIKVSRIAIMQLFQNLISNAIKYQEEKVTPVIFIESTESQTHWQFIVTDNGIGISKDNFASIFTMFKRLHRKEKYSGTGIGLAICKKIVELYGGEIWVESKEGNGSQFYFNILKNNI
ncbi:MAG: GHKL domain-containing protein [Bacteroidia bacterium]|nr:GHKL domain-containing protein [Bacteroidia bacterium]